MLYNADPSGSWRRSKRSVASGGHSIFKNSRIGTITHYGRGTMGRLFKRTVPCLCALFTVALAVLLVASARADGTFDFGVCSGNPCDDGDPTTCDDSCHLVGSGPACGSGCGCAGTPVPEPTAIDNSVRLAKTPTNTTIAWTDAPGPYRVYRGSVMGSWAYNQTCLAGTTATSTTDTANPPTTTSFYYLVSRKDRCRESTLGRNSFGSTIPNNNPCP